MAPPAAPAVAWVAISVWVALPWLHDLAELATWPAAVAMITLVAYVPGYLVALLCSSLPMDRLPLSRVTHPSEPITVLIAARNERTTIGPTLAYLSTQDYDGRLSIVVIDNGSDDGTAGVARQRARELGSDVRVITEPTPGKSHARNAGLRPAWCWRSPVGSGSSAPTPCSWSPCRSGRHC